MKGQLLNKIILIIFLSPVCLFAQPGSPVNHGIAGLWKGELYNDTTKKFLPFEIVISDDNGKLSGYSYTLFDIEGKKELGIKKIKIKRKDDEVSIDDIELISNNYSAPPPRGVRFHCTVNLSVKDTVLQLSGKWNTNRTREYAPYNGSLQLQRSIDYNPEVLFRELVRLKLDQGLSFVKAERRSDPDMAIVEKPLADMVAPATVPPQPSASGNDNDLAATSPKKKIEGLVEGSPPVKPSRKQALTPVTYKPEVVITAAPEKIATKADRPELAIIKNRPAAELFKITTGKRTPLIIPLTSKNREQFVAARDKRKEAYQLAYNKAQTAIAAQLAIAKEAAKKPPVEVAQKPAAEKKPATTAPPVVINKPADPVKEPVRKESNPAAITIAPTDQKTTASAFQNTPAAQNAAAEVSERKMKNEQSVVFESDSLVLTLYDNGEVDGDTVSVLMNGQIIFAKQGLSTKANSKTIYIDKTMPDTLSMIMYAENLGSIPPNTGLLIIMDGEKRYEVRFSADLKTNAAIMLRRRKKDS